MAIVDIIVIAILMIGLIVGFTKGFVTSIFGLIATVLALVAAYYLSGPFIQLLEKMGWQVHSMVNGWFESLLGNVSAGGFQLNQSFGDLESLKQGIDTAKNGMGLLSPIFATMFDKVAAGAVSLDFANGQTYSIASLLAPYVANPVLVIMAVIVLFIIIRIILYILERILEKVLTIAPLKTVDRLLGMVVGLAEAVIFLLVAITILNLVIPNPENVVMRYMLDSKIVVWINSWNPIPGWLAGIKLFG